MEKDIDQVKIIDVRLTSMNVVRNEVKTNKEYPIEIQLKHSIEKENENYVILLCNLSLGTEESPFEINISVDAEVRKSKSITGDELLSVFPEIAYPILAEMSLSVAQVVTAMGYPTLIISPKELMQVLIE